MRRLPSSPAADGAVALTFDDGPDPDVTPKILEILRQRSAGASFFCVGQRAERHPHLIADIVARGHRVENHTYRHSNAFAFLGPRGMGREIDRAQLLLGRLAGTPPAYFRAPAGMRNPWLNALLAARSLDLVSWTRRGFDTVSRDPATIVARLVKNVRAGDVIVLHDGASASDASGQPVVLDVLPMLLDELDRCNLRPVAIPRPA